MRRTRPVRTLLSAAATVGLIGVLAGPVALASTPATTSAFTCAEDLQSACSVVFGPLCRKQFCA